MLVTLAVLGVLLGVVATALPRDARVPVEGAAHESVVERARQEAIRTARRVQHVTWGPGYSIVVSASPDGRVQVDSAHAGMTSPSVVAHELP